MRLTQLASRSTTVLVRALRAIWGQRIRDARQAAGLTQAQLALALGVDQANVSRWERGMLSPRDDRRARIAEILGVDAASLFSYDPNDGEAAA
jgi:transcriptional regulator with XRE-family HTH domain